MGQIEKPCRYSWNDMRGQSRRVKDNKGKSLLLSLGSRFRDLRISICSISIMITRILHRAQHTERCRASQTRTKTDEDWPTDYRTPSHELPPTTKKPTDETPTRIFHAVLVVLGDEGRHGMIVVVCGDGGQRRRCALFTISPLLTQLQHCSPQHTTISRRV
ncbi:hypothetical protein ARMSODRAFT_666784 [Armillaria solidipes]|uniref:Uncharacterized protein n=1 Tax=Armillaria solidipes TaxID=1076256 RepID=A0A2H3AX19_9AGAR|nr:hypothetical protein ARMSODRAFT_666784 [Armillaria solidipes]